MQTQLRESWSGYINIRPIDFKAKKISRDKEKYYIIIEGPIYQAAITGLNVYAPNYGV